jgi:PAS domain S-box-containing protein
LKDSKKNRIQGNGIKYLFILIIVVICILSYTSYVQLRELKDSNRLVNHTIEVKYELFNYAALVKEIPLKERGFIATSNIYFLKEFEEIISEIDTSLTKLKLITQDNSNYNSLDTLAAITQLIVDDAQKNVDSIPNQDVLYESLILERNRLNKIRTFIERFNEMEDKLLLKRKQELEDSGFSTSIVVASLLVFCLFLLIVSYLKINKDRFDKQKLIDELYKNSQELEGALAEIKLHKLELIESKTNARFKVIADTMPQLVWTADAQGNLNFFSQSVFDYTGKALDQILSDGWLEIVHADDRDQNIKLWGDSISTGKPFLFEHRFLTKSEGYRWQLSRALPVRNEHGVIEMWVGTSTDIHKNKQFQQELEKEVKERTKALNETNIHLEKTNTELEQFAFIASHDLQEPLRKIQTLSNMISDRELKNLSENGVLLFERIANSAKHMQQLIRDILDYSKSGSTSEDIVNIDLNEVFDRIEQEFNEFLPEKKFTLIKNNLPITKGISVQIEQVFFNLISNSIKFKKTSVDCIITVSSEKVQGKTLNIPFTNKVDWYYHITVSDNGIGFDNEYRDKIFQVFQRLNSKEKYSGTGIGLALVKKIIDQHNGYITAESELDKGATFSVYLPVI